MAVEPMEIGLSFGSNIGDKVGTIRKAVALLAEDGVVREMTLSSCYRTAPWGHVVDQDWFVNVCGVGTTDLAPADLLFRVKHLEHRLGRTDTVRWGPRVIDIDILFLGALRVDTPGLTVPHKELLRRAFVLIPLAEIRPNLVIGGTTIRAAADALGPDGVEALPESVS